MLNQRYWSVVLLFVAVAIFVSGYVGAFTQVERADEQLRDEIQEQAAAVARTIDINFAKTLSFTAADAQLPEYQILSEQLSAYQKVNHYGRVYTLAQRGDEIVMGPQSESADDVDVGAPGLILEQNADHYLQVFQLGRPTVAVPDTNEAPSYITAFAPVEDPRNGEVLMVVGIDVSTTVREARLDAARRTVWLRTLGLIAVLSGGLLLLRWGQRNINRLGWLRYREAIFVLVFGMAVTLVLALAAQQGEKLTREEAFRQLAENRAQLVLKAFESLQDEQLGSLANLFESSDAVERAEFTRFTSPMVAGSAIEAMVWVQAVAAGERAQWEQRAREEGLESFTIWQMEDGQPVAAHGRPIYYPVWYLEPYADNPAALGFDEGSGPERSAALEAAIESGLATASNPVVLVTEEAGEPSLIAFKPVRDDAGELLGAAMAVVRLDEFLQSILLFNGPEMGSALVDLHQLNGEAPPTFLASSIEAHSDLHRLQAEREETLFIEMQDLYAVYPMFVFSKSYAIVVQADDDFLAAYPARAGSSTLLLGSLLTALVAGLTYYLSSRRDALEREVKARTSELEASKLDLLTAYDATIEGWSHALELRDEETEGHTRRVTRLTEQLAQAMGLEEEDLEHVRRGAMLHDIGKIGIPDKILRKPGELTEEEWQLVRRHPEFAREMLSSIDYLEQALDIPYSHHERWDGEGYPQGLRGIQIPLSARIFAVVDVYDALTSDRPYRKAWPKEKALQYIKEQRGKQFDPRVVDTFFAEFGFSAA